MIQLILIFAFLGACFVILMPVALICIAITVIAFLMFVAWVILANMIYWPYVLSCWLIEKVKNAF